MQTRYVLSESAYRTLMLRANNLMCSDVNAIDVLSLLMDLMEELTFVTIEEGEDD